jgi:hypothetical protein
MRGKRITSVMLFMFFTVMVSRAQQPAPASSRIAPATSSQARSSYGNLPLMFEANRGQSDSQVKFLSRGSGYSLFLTAGGMVLALQPLATTASSDFAQTILSLPSHPKLSPIRQQEKLVQQHQQSTTVTINLVGAMRNPTIVGEEPLATRVNYFIGRDPSQWLLNVPAFGRIRYRNLYPGIDLVYYGSNHRVEYDFDLAPGADATKIQFAVKGAEALKIDGAGNLVLNVAGTQLLFQTPAIYQESNGVRSPVSGSYVLRDATHVGFAVGSHDRSAPLVIDPVLVYSSFLGGSGDDFPGGIAVDSSDDAYVTGVTDSPNFPLATLGSYNSTQFRMYLTEFNPTGSSLLFADYFGGTSGGDAPAGVALDSSGNPYITGVATSSDFPVMNAFQSSLAGSQDAFVVKFSADGSSIIYSTYLGGGTMTAVGGSISQYGNAIAVDPSGEAIVAGVTMATDFPTASAYQSSISTDQFGDWGEYGFVTKFAANGESLVYSTYLAGATLNTTTCSGCFPDSEVLGVASDGSGNAYVTGITTTADFPVTSGAFATTSPGYYLSDVGFVSKFTNSGAISYSTYLGGLTSSFLNAVAVDSTGAAYVTGYDSANDNFPIVTTSICDPSSAACNGAVIVKLNPTGTSLDYSTFIGTSNNMTGQMIQVDAAGDAFIEGSDVALDLANPIETYAGGDGDVVVAEIDPTASTLLMATFLGGQGVEAAGGLALDGSGNVYVTGITQSLDFPVTESSFQTAYGGQNDTFISEINPTMTAAAVAMGPFSLEFGSQDVGTTSPPQTTILRNMGSASLGIASKTMTGDFAETDDCGPTVAAASTCTFNITFLPTATGTRTGTLTITDDAAGSPHTVSLTGTGLSDPPFARVSPSQLVFSSSPISTPTAAQSVTVTNSSNQPLNLNAPQTTGDFAVTGNNCSSVAANGTCTVQVNFKPTSVGTSTGTLELVDTATGNSQTVPLSGSGVDFATTAVNSSASVNAGSTATYELNIAPQGGNFSQAITFTCQGAPAAATCTVNPNSITPSRGSSTVTVTVKTSGRAVQAGAAISGGALTGKGRFVAAQLLAPFGIFGLLVLGVSSQRKVRAKLVAGAVTMFLLFSLAACAGGTGTQPSAAGSNVTPAGTYGLSVVATSGDLQHITKLTLIVQ